MCPPAHMESSIAKNISMSEALTTLLEVPEALLTFFNGTFADVLSAMCSNKPKGKRSEKIFFRLMRAFFNALIPGSSGSEICSSINFGMQQCPVTFFQPFHSASERAISNLHGKNQKCWKCKISAHAHLKTLEFSKASSWLASWCIAVCNWISFSFWNLSAFKEMNSITEIEKNFRLGH